MQNRSIELYVQPAVCICLALSVVFLPINWVFAWLIAIMVHEGGHLAAVVMCRKQIYSIHFTMRGAVIITELMTRRQQIFSILAGPCSGFLLLTISRWVPQIAICGCIQSVYNLLPIQYLDGGRAMYEILARFFSERNVRTICTIADRTIRITLCVSGLLLAWKLMWLSAAFFSLLLLLEKRNRKTPCKHLPQRVQYQQM